MYTFQILSTTSNFNNITNNQNFVFYYLNSKTIKKLRRNEINTIMDITSNLRVISGAPSAFHFQNKTYRVALPSKDVFQSTASAFHFKYYVCLSI